MASAKVYDIQSLQRMLEHEHNDVELQGIYNNLGLAHLEKRDYRRSLNAHRQEKNICKRLKAAAPADPARHLDLAIAYRRCGDVMLKLDRLVGADDKPITTRPAIVRLAQHQHLRGYHVARGAPDSAASRAARDLELQAASSARAHSALALALHTRDPAHFLAVTRACVVAARRANRLRVGTGLTHDRKRSVLLGIAVNHAIALSGCGQRALAKRMLHSVAMQADKVDDHHNYVRALSNLGEEASEDGDYPLSAAYVREWARLARREEDYPDEADALRKLAIVLREMGDLDGARNELERAVTLPAGDEAEMEAKNFLDVVNTEIVERHDAEERLEKCESDALRSGEKNDYVNEAIACVGAGNSAHILQRYEVAVRYLSRYFQLVEDYDCDLSLTRLPRPTHNTAVANMGESMWKLKRFEEAVDWATKELATYDGDLPGQAQAWCNIGVYLDDYGKKEKAIDALEMSVQLANSCGEKDVADRAANNLECVKEALAEEKAKQTAESGRNAAEVFADPPLVMEGENELENSRAGQSSIPARNNEDVIEEDKEPLGSHDLASIVIDSSQPHKRRKSAPSGTQTQGAVSFRHGNRSSGGDQHSSRGSRGAFTDEHGSRTTTNIVNLPTRYKSICAKRERPSVQTREMVVSAIREMGRSLLARDACDADVQGAARLNLSGLFLRNEDVSVVVDTLTGVGIEHAIALDISLNPLLTPSAYECLRTRAGALDRSSGIGALYSVKELDVSCAGLSPEAVRKLADAMSEHGVLAEVTRLRAGKNALGNQPRVALAVARLLAQAAKLEELDLSHNLLSNQFLKELVENLGEIQVNKDGDKLRSQLQSLDFRMNNRRKPTGMLELNDVEGTMKHVEKLFDVLPCLETINVRACGANKGMRKALSSFAARMTDARQRRVITVSDTIQDDTD